MPVPVKNPVVGSLSAVPVSQCAAVRAGNVVASAFAQAIYLRQTTKCDPVVQAMSEFMNNDIGVLGIVHTAFAESQAACSAYVVRVICAA